MTTLPLTIEKPKVRKGLSYALKTSWVEQALRDARVECPASLHYWTPQSGGSLLQAFYWLPDANVPHDRVYIRAGTVDSVRRQDAALQLQNRGLPAFVQWLRTVASLPRNSPVLHQKPMFDAAYMNGRLQVWSLPPVSAADPGVAADAGPG